MLDCLFINPPCSALYQGLSKDFSAREPNIWALMLANSVQTQGFSAGYLDVEADQLPYNEAAATVKYENPRLIVIVCTGQNPNASSASMAGAIKLAKEIKSVWNDAKICFVGPHVNALPLETLSFDCVDIVLTNEGVYALWNLLASDFSENSLSKINGIAWKELVVDGKNDNKDYIGLSLNYRLRLNPPERIVPQDRLEYDLPGIAFNLLGDVKRFRTSGWHANFIQEDTSPFVSLYTSLGCPYQCSFCMINIINRTDNDPTKAADSFNVFRHWKPETIIKWFDTLADLGVKHIKLADELFSNRPKHCVALADLLAERQQGFNIWAYTRVNTVKESYLESYKKAGINWLAIGVESASEVIRTEITKGKFKEENIRDIIGRIKQYDINVGGNFLVGTSHLETQETMQETLDLALELQCENMNVYAAMCLPGSPLFLKARERGWEMPTSFEQYGFLSYECLPVPSNTLSAADILQFRDNFFQQYFNDPSFLSMTHKKFGQKAIDSIKKMTDIPLYRKILGHPQPV